MVEEETRIALKILKSDCDGEFFSKEFQAIL